VVVFLRALTVDDEPLASERLRKMLGAEPAVQVIGVSDNGYEALTAVRRDTPDLVFLDVHMPKMDVFAFIKALPSGPLPLIIAVTAHEQYAARAFEVEAVDYLLKPFDRACVMVGLPIRHRNAPVRAFLEAFRPSAFSMQDGMQYKDRA
jgi:DNA-binding LytR/AlgR family response regulator